MQDPNIKTKVVHSEKNAAWNVVGATIGGKYKIARCPYVVSKDEDITARERAEALLHAQFISWCFNNSSKVLRNEALTPVDGKIILDATYFDEAFFKKVDELRGYMFGVQNDVFANIERIEHEQPASIFHYKDTSLQK